MKVDKAYNNKDLLDALKDRDKTYEDILNYADKDYSDEEIIKLNKIKNLTQFQKDLLYLSSKMSVYDIADLYSVSARYLYNHIKIIKDILK